MIASRSKDKMWKILCLVAVAIIGIAEGCTYKNRECPDYTVVEEHADYEIRKYPEITWAETSAVSRYRRVGQYRTFMRLFHYISGQNDRKQKMEMTVPVRMDTTVGENGTQTRYGMSFMLPSEFALNPPRPDDDSVHLLRERETLYAVRKFNGYIWRQATWEAEAQKLAESVKEDETVDKTTYYAVGYDAPFEFFNRRNEIWMVKKVK